MKRNILIALILCNCIFILKAQILNESFNDSVFPPSGWTSVKVSGSALPGTWLRIESGNNPAALPHSGAGMAYFNAYSWSSGNDADLATPALDFSSGNFIVSFWMYRDNGFDTRTDKVEVYVNTSGASSSGTLLGTINRSRTLSPIENSNGWFQYSFSVPSNFNGASNYIIFKGISGFGNRIYLDDVSVFSNSIPNNPAGITAASTSVCPNDSVKLIATGVSGQAYWYSDSCSGNLLGTGDSITVYPSQNTTYFVRNFNNNTFSAGCASLTINVNQVYNIVITDSICQGEIYQLPDGSTATVDSSYIFNYTSALGCDSTITVLLTVNNLPVVNITEINGVLATDDTNFVSYNWYIDSNLINGADSAMLIPVQEGNYYVQVTDSNGCTAFSQQYNYLATDINNVFLQNSFLIYPNPFSNLIFIQSDNNISEIRILSVDGRIIRDYSFQENKMNTDDLDKGTYFVCIYTNDGKRFIKQIVKN